MLKLERQYRNRSKFILFLIHNSLKTDSETKKVILRLCTLLNYLSFKKSDICATVMNVSG